MVLGFLNFGIAFFQFPSHYHPTYWGEYLGLICDEKRVVHMASRGPRGGFNRITPCGPKVWCLKNIPRGVVHQN